MKRWIVRSALDALYVARAHRLLGNALGGIGVILTLHRVRPADGGGFQPNRYLEITPQFLDSAITHIKREGFDIVSLDEMYDRLHNCRGDDRFLCITFDDGYRDNKEYAYPILKRHGAPFAIYVASDMPDRRGRLWWLSVEKAIAKSEMIEMPTPAGVSRLPCRTYREKYAAISAIHRTLRMLPNDRELRKTVSEIAARAGIDEAAEVADVCLSWRELRSLATDPLVTIGAHTASHPILSKISHTAVQNEMSQSAARIAAELGTHPLHFAYPFGDRGAAGEREFSIARELGFKTAVTTRPGVLFPEHRLHLWALPRISLNGEMQRIRQLQPLLSGVGTSIWNGFRRLDVA